MSLFTPKSTILALIQEAEEMSVTPDQDMSLPDGGMGVGDIASDLSASAPTAPPAPESGNLQVGSIPAGGNSVPTTVSKTVVNTGVLLSQLSELKSVIANYEKKFEDENVDIESAKIQVAGLLNTLIYHAEKLQAFLGLSDAGGAPATPPPAPVAPPPAPDASAVPGPPPVITGAAEVPPPAGM